jgi:hypothetical protein
MKKLLLAVGLCVVAFVLAPVASANAETFAGACVIKGTATFESPTRLSTGLPQMQTYKFKGKVVVCAKNIPEGELAGIVKKKAECEDPKLTKAQMEVCYAELIELVLAAVKAAGAVEGSAEVEGGGKLSCAASIGGYGKVGTEETLPAGKGKIEVGGVTAKFKFRFTGTGTEVHFQAGDEAEPETTGYTATGEASFAQDTGAIAECSSEVGPASLEFAAVTAGVI